jgi:phosphoribosyl 1,2-cyclic phosphodiesterase
MYPSLPAEVRERGAESFFAKRQICSSIVLYEFRFMFEWEMKKSASKGCCRKMKIEFLGTRGYIEEKSELHGMHSSCLISYYSKRIMIDCGNDWLGGIEEVSPDVIMITHAHPDHADGLKNGAPCPVYASGETHEIMSGFDISERRILGIRKPVEILNMTVEAFALSHSTRAPAVGYRITAGNSTIFYAPDVVYIHGREKALGGVKVYIGDGATLDQSFVRKQKDKLIGHTPVRTQLTWCKKFNIPRAVITHCGSQIVGGDLGEIDSMVQKMGEERGVEVQIAFDGMEMILR